MTATSDSHDELLQEWDVFVGTELSPFLHLCPLQSASLAIRFNHLDGCTTGRFKSAAKRLDLQLPFSASEREFLEEERAKQLQMSEGMRICGSGWPWRPVQYMVGRFVDDELFLNPVESVIPLAPSLSGLDEFEARQRAASTLPSSGNNYSSSRHHRSEESLHSPQPASSSPQQQAHAQTKTIQMQFRKKETDEQVQARLNSFAYLQRQVDDEPWQPLKHFSGNAPELEVVRERLITTCREPIQFAAEAEDDYVGLVVGLEAIKTADSAQEVQ